MLVKYAIISKLKTFIMTTKKINILIMNIGSLVHLLFYLFIFFFFNLEN